MDATVKSHFTAKEEHAPAKPLVFWRPTAKTGLISWLTTVDHKKIGFLYGLFALFFLLVGGTKDTHEEMTEKAIKINEKLKARGKQLETVSKAEFDDIAHEVGLKKFPAK